MILWAIKALVLYGWQDVTLHTVTLMIQWHLFEDYLASNTLRVLIEIEG